MPDYDVAATSLVSPPTSAPVTSYRPTVAVKNQGLHTANVTGLLRLYDKATGELLQTHQLAATDIAPGQTKNAPSASLWIPTEGDIGKQFLVIATINYPPDQYTPNNHLQPTTITVTAEEPPEPPIITEHAAQHEHDGVDEIDVEGLHGELHEPQTPKAHAADHELDGGDQLNVDGLAGVLSEPQTPASHDNAAHVQPFATVAQLTAHTAGDPVHAGATNLEQTAHKGAANGYSPLDASSQIPWPNVAAGAVHLIGAVTLYQSGSLNPQEIAEVAIVSFPQNPSYSAVFAIGSANLLWSQPTTPLDVEAWCRILDAAGETDGNRSGHYHSAIEQARHHLSTFGHWTNPTTIQKVSLVLRNVSDTDFIGYERLTFLVFAVR